MNDNQSLISATTQYGSAIRTYDDGYGPLWISRDSMGINGIVRARTWEDAYGICEDEFFPDCDLTHEELIKEYGFTREHVRWIHPLNADGTLDQSTERAVALVDFPLKEGQFVRWETVDTPCDDYVENECFQEAYGFRPNSGGKNPIYSKDINGDYLDRLTPELAKELGITLEIETLEVA